MLACLDILVLHLEVPFETSDEREPLVGRTAQLTSFLGNWIGATADTMMNPVPRLKQLMIVSTW